MQRTPATFHMMEKLSDFVASSETQLHKNKGNFSLRHTSQL